MARWPVQSIEENFWEKVGPHDDPIKCWLWLGTKTNINKEHHGLTQYGRFTVDGKKVLAHRFSYEMHYHVTIPEGMTIDHVKARGCSSTLCVNPYHLEVVTQKDNLLRGNTFQAKNAKKTHCPQGHPYNDENTYVLQGARYCRVCNVERQQRYRVKKAHWIESSFKDGACVEIVVTEV